MSFTSEEIIKTIDDKFLSKVTEVEKPIVPSYFLGIAKHNKSHILIDCVKEGGEVVNFNQYDEIVKHRVSPQSEGAKLNTNTYQWKFKEEEYEELENVVRELFLHYDLEEDVEIFIRTRLSKEKANHLVIITVADAVIVKK